MNDISPNDADPVGIPVVQAKRMRWLLILATGLFLVGICLPMITVSKFIVVSNSFSVMSGVLELLSNGHILLFSVVAAFSIVLPILKIGVLFKLLGAESFQTPKIKRYLHLMHEYGRWAMLDVMVVAVLIVTVKLDAIASIEVHGGLYVFGASVLLIMLITNKIVRLTSHEGV
ncbi:paraquat-inducible protein A [Pontibacterium sp. N1Y112]|uniref:Paraquat-inducible protein A n=1 Tax=Pontibacterium sinense TaxID=2781979 RepID=A0A8J7F6P3_9GAMM|nr:paraquat-inducible protein A [Pontibacterium sinense]MBE9396085.1 paraquat-inducible protein A [Pontibacterium sinense]